MPGTTFQPGDWVVYSKTKHSTRPGPRATEISPSQAGDTYSYVVDKYWVVTEVRDGRIRVRTRRGKQHEVDLDDPNLHRATWWERLRYRSRFRAIEAEPPHGAVESSPRITSPVERVS